MSRGLSLAWIKDYCVSLVRPEDDGSVKPRNVKTVQVLRAHEKSTTLLVSDRKSCITLFLTPRCAEEFRSATGKSLVSLQGALIKLESWVLSTTIMCVGTMSLDEVPAQHRPSLPLAIQASRVTYIGGDGNEIFAEPVQVNADADVQRALASQTHLLLSRKLVARQGLRCLPDREGFDYASARPLPSAEEREVSEDQKEALREQEGWADVGSADTVGGPAVRAGPPPARGGFVPPEGGFAVPNHAALSVIDAEDLPPSAGGAAAEPVPPSPRVLRTRSTPRSTRSRGPPSPTPPPTQVQTQAESPIEATQLQGPPSPSPRRRRSPRTPRNAASTSVSRRAETPSPSTQDLALDPAPARGKAPLLRQESSEASADDALDMTRAALQRMQSMERTMDSMKGTPEKAKMQRLDEQISGVKATLSRAIKAGAKSSEKRKRKAAARKMGQDKRERKEKLGMPWLAKYTEEDRGAAPRGVVASLLSKINK